MSNKRGLKVALKSVRKVIEDLKTSSSAGQPIQPDQALLLIEEWSEIADVISAYQDEIAAEASSGTAGKRVSVRKHRK
jgi:hypothetical protein